MADELTRCLAWHRDRGVQCMDKVTKMTVHYGDHWADLPDGHRLCWDNSASGDGPFRGRVDVGIPASERQVGGDHYRRYKIQPWDIWEEYGLNAFEGAIVKYLLRRKGDRLEDLRKARHTLDKLIEIEEANGG